MAILGAVLGDILGAQYEFDRPKDLDWKNVLLISEHGVGFMMKIIDLMEAGEMVLL